MPAYQLLVFSNARPAREAEYREWYCRQHLPDVLKLPGFLSGTFYGVVDIPGAPAPRFRHLAVYQLQFEEPVQALAALAAVAGSEQMPLTDAIAPSAVSMNVGAAVETVGSVSGIPATLMVALANTLDGQFAEFDRWYNEQQLGDVKAVVQGCQWAQRLALQTMPGVPAPEWSHAALYGLNAEWPQTMVELKHLGGPPMPLSQALDVPHLTIALFQPLAAL